MFYSLRAFVFIVVFVYVGGLSFNKRAYSASSSSRYDRWRAAKRWYRFVFMRIHRGTG